MAKQGVSTAYKRCVGARLLLVVAMVLGAFMAHAQDYPAVPNPPRLVNDFSKMLTAEECDLLEYKLDEFSYTNGAQIAIVTIDSLNGIAIKEFAVTLANKWGIGQKDKNNGILILIAKKERQDFIATGMGIEQIVTNELAKKIRESYLEPNFKLGKYYNGFDKTTDALIKLLSHK